MEVRHYLTFEFAGIDEKFVYMVTEDIKRWIQHELLHRDWNIQGPVIEFEEHSGRKIAINAQYVRRCQALYDAGMFPAEKEDDDKPDVMFVVEGMSKPLYYNDIDPDAAALIASVVAGVYSEPYSFVSFIDEDGEPNLIAANKVMLLESLHYDDDYEEHE